MAFHLAPGAVLRSDFSHFPVGQRPDGGWSKGNGPSDLETSYRVMRAFFMLKAQPDLEKLRGFLARFRESDGGYVPEPGKAADFAVIDAPDVNHWLYHFRPNACVETVIGGVTRWLAA